MKKFFCLLLVCLLPVVAFAETDLSSMSYDDLVKLQKAVVSEIMSRPEWKEVTVPAGLWRVGDDIPAGMYSVRTENSARVSVWLKQKNDFSENGLYFNEVVRSDAPCGKLILKKGMLMDISSAVVMAPPLALGF